MQRLIAVLVEGEIDLVGEAGGVPVELWFDVEIKQDITTER